MVQKSILSFFGGGTKTPQRVNNTEDKNKKKDNGSGSSTKKSEKKKETKEDIADSPIKSVSRRKARVIESDSEDELQESQSSMDVEEKENKQTDENIEENVSSDNESSKEESPVKVQKSLSRDYKEKLKKFKADDFKELEDRSPKENGKNIKSFITKDKTETPGSSKCTGKKKLPGFTPDSVPPKRVTAQKKRKSSDSECKPAKKLHFEENNDNSTNNEVEIKEEKQSSPEKLNLSPKKLEKDDNTKCNKKKTSGSPNKKSPSSSKEKIDTSKDLKSPKKESINEKSSTKSPKEETSDNKNVIKKNQSPENKKNSTPARKPGINPFAKKSTSEDPGAAYDPSRNNYHPIDHAFWKKGEKVPYLALAKTLEKIEATSGRLKNIEILSNFLRSVLILSPEDLLNCIYLCLNKVAPAFTGIEIMVGETILYKSIAQCTGRTVDKIKADVAELGDVGIVAEQSKSNQRMMMQPAKLTVSSVFLKLKDIASMTGTSSQSNKVDKIKGMFVACRYSEARYLMRSLSGKLRIGLAEQSVLHAIGQACYLTPPGQDYPPEIINAGKGHSAESVKAKVESVSLIVKTTYCECPSYDIIIPVLLADGIDELPKKCKLAPGIPLKPMLAHPTKGISEVLKRFENAKFTCEYKYDGERAQIHLHDDGTIDIYSRNQETNTTKYPDIINRFKNSLGENVKSCIIDSEAVAWDRENKQILPFQILSTRKRKDANESEIKVQVCVFPFDLLYLNGESLVRSPFEHRRKLLKDNFIEVEGEFTFAKSMDSADVDDIQEFLNESIKGNCEGLMVKTLDVDSTYEIAKRSHNWLKVKKDYLDGVGDTLDLVAIGGYLGKGKRVGHYGGFLLGCYDPENEEFQSICKIGTGFTDENLQTHSAFFKDHIIEKPKSYYRYDNSHTPDHWFDAVQVWEVKCADLSISPVHKAAAGLVDPEKGISLRFPRFLRIREDKNVEQATSSSQVAELYNNQDQIKNKTGGDANEEDFY